jgi:hypothetical protein
MKLIKHLKVIDDVAQSFVSPQRIKRNQHQSIQQTTSLNMVAEISHWIVNCIGRAGSLVYGGLAVPACQCC